MDHKRCTKCGKVKPLDTFSPARGHTDGRRSDCKACKAAAERKYRLTHPEKVRERNRKWRLANLEKAREQQRKRNIEHPEKRRKIDRKYHLTHPEKKREYHAEKCKNDPLFRLAHQTRSRMYTAIKHGYKAGSAVRDLGRTIPELKTYLEALWQPGMTWENHGRHKEQRCWEIDHIKPLSAFDLTDRKQFLKAVHYTNLQPLWASENQSKGARIG